VAANPILAPHFRQATEFDVPARSALVPLPNDVNWAGNILFVSQKALTPLTKPSKVRKSTGLQR
jgi:hypothetical protein